MQVRARQQNRTVGAGLPKPIDDEFFGWGRQRAATEVDGGDGDGDGGGDGGGGGGGYGVGASASVPGSRCGSRRGTGNHDRMSRMSLMSDASSMASAASAAILEENAFLVVGGASFSSIMASYRMARTGGGAEPSADARYSCMPTAESSSGGGSLLRNVAGDVAPQPPGRFGSASTHASEALLPREALLADGLEGDVRTGAVE